MRHFEKKGKLGLFRRIGTQGRSVKLVIGRAGEGDERVSIRCRSAALAERAAGVWVKWALDAGYAEVELPAGVRLGVVATLEAPEGPGRIRLDRRVDVQFLPAKPPLRFDVGDRVLVTGIHRTKTRARYMFGSALRVRTVAPFPKPRWSAFSPRKEPAAAIRKSLERLAGAAILGHVELPRAFPRTVLCGALIFSYEKGVHRFLRLDRGGSVLSEPVLTSNFLRQSAPPSSCVAGFCAPVPPKLAREIARHYEL